MFIKLRKVGIILISAISIFTLLFSSFAPFLVRAEASKDDDSATLVVSEADQIDTRDLVADSQSGGDASSDSSGGNKSSKHEDSNTDENTQSEKVSNGLDEKITICHATHSENNPYVQITISRNGLNGHENHNNHNGDIIPRLRK